MALQLINPLKKYWTILIGLPVNTTHKEKRTVKLKAIYKILFVFVLIILIARIALPYIVLNVLNKKLANMEGYYGHIEDIDITLYRGAYQLNKLSLKKIAKNDTVNFIAIGKTDLSIEWKPIFRGSIVGKVFIDSGVVQITKDKNEIKDIAKDTADFRTVLNGMMPIKLNRFEMNNLSIHYRDFSSKPNLDLALTNIHLVALNLANAYDSTMAIPASVNMMATLYDGDFNLNIKFNPYAEKPRFDLNTSLQNTDLVQLNDFLKAYANIDVNKGKFGLFSEIAAKEGYFEGYVKPLIKDLDVASLKEKDPPLQFAWESLVGAVAWVVTNKKEDQLGTKIYLEGTFKEPDINLAKAVVTVLHNAFVKALYPSIDKEINLGSVQPEKIKEKKKKGFFKKLFDKEKKEPDKN